MHMPFCWNWPQFYSYSNSIKNQALLRVKLAVWKESHWSRHWSRSWRPGDKQSLGNWKGWVVLSVTFLTPTLNIVVHTSSFISLSGNSLGQRQDFVCRLSFHLVFSMITYSSRLSPRMHEQSTFIRLMESQVCVGWTWSWSIFLKRPLVFNHWMIYRLLWWAIEQFKCSSQEDCSSLDR